MLHNHGMQDTRMAWIVELSRQILDLLDVFNGMGAKDLGKGMRSIVNVLATLYVEALAASKLATDFTLYVEEKSSNNLVFNLWCFNAGLALKSLLDRGVRAVCLTSGTLKPMDATIRELGFIDFPVQHVGEHVITPRQVGRQ